MHVLHYFSWLSCLKCNTLNINLHVMNYAVSNWLAERTDWRNKTLQHFCKTTTTRTLLDRTLTVTLIPTLRPTSTLALLRWQLYRTLEVVSETITHILQPYNICVAHKPITTLRWLLTNVKDKDILEDRQRAVYKIKCCNCQATYIGETGRNLATRLTEHKQGTRNGDVNNHIAEQHLQTKHQIDWDSATYIAYSTDYYHFRKLVYSLRTNTTGS